MSQVATPEVWKDLPNRDRWATLSAWWANQSSAHAAFLERHQMDWLLNMAYPHSSIREDELEKPPKERTTRACRGCGALMFWASSPNGKPMPLDAKETTIAVFDDENPREPVKLVRGHVPHHITCPKAANFKKGADR